MSAGTTNFYSNFYGVFPLWHQIEDRLEKKWGETEGMAILNGKILRRMDYSASGTMSRELHGIRVTLVLMEAF